MEHFVTDFFRIGAMFSKVRQLTILISYNFASIASCHQNIIQIILSRHHSRSVNIQACVPLEIECYERVFFMDI